MRVMVIIKATKNKGQKRATTYCTT